jgi:hypothetical protein
MDRLPVYGNIDHAGAFPGWFNAVLTRIRAAETCWLSRNHSLPIGASLVCLAQKQG